MFYFRTFEYKLSPGTWIKTSSGFNSIGFSWIEKNIKILIQNVPNKIEDIYLGLKLTNLTLLDYNLGYLNFSGCPLSIINILENRIQSFNIRSFYNIMSSTKHKSLMFVKLFNSWDC